MHNPLVFLTVSCLGLCNRKLPRFMQRIVSVVGKDVPGIERFISDFDAYAKSIILEAGDRETDHIRTVNEYMVLRRDTCGAKPTFSFFALGLNIPDGVFDNPLMISLIENAADLVAITNVSHLDHEINMMLTELLKDMHSYRLERSRGLEGHNIITAIMAECRLDLQQALFWLSGYASKTISNFLTNSCALPSWGQKTDEAIRMYIDLVGRCVRGL